MSDRAVAALAGAVWLGALVPLGSSRLLMLGVAVLALAALRNRLPVVVVLASALLASAAAGVAWDRIDSVEPPAQFVGPARFVVDPEPVAGGVRAEVVIGGDRYLVRAWGSPAGHLRPRLMGERVWIEANLRPLRDAPAWLRARGLVGRGTITSVSGFDVGSPHTRLANSVRRTIESGSTSLTRDEQSLFAGLVYGDDRNQSPLVSDNFTAAGLTHLLAVSGQNVAFVLAICGPVLRRVGFRQRFALVVAILVLFATVTRFEPSVMRASVMTAVAAVAALIGSEVSGQRMLCLAVAALILIDPLMVHSVAFQLSVAASAGILLWSGRVARAVPGPRMFAEALAVTASAQLAVAPLLVWRFDGLPVASLPANLVAGPAAGPVMMWGLTGGLVAGLVPAGLAEVLHWPTKVGVGWIDAVARVAVGLPLGVLGPLHIVGLFLVARSWLRAVSSRRRLVLAALGLSVLIHPAVAVALTPATTVAIDDHSMIWRDGDHTVLALDPGTGAQDVLSALRFNNVGRIDLVITSRSTYGQAQLVRWIETRHHVTAVWAPDRTMGVGEVAIGEPRTVILAGVELAVEAVGGDLAVAPVQIVDSAPDG